MNMSKELLLGLKTVKSEIHLINLRWTAVGVPPRWPRDTLLSITVGSKIRRPVAVDQSVLFAYGLNATELTVFSFNAFSVDEILIARHHSFLGVIDVVTKGGISDNVYTCYQLICQGCSSHLRHWPQCWNVSVPL
jgi:hypothetical protein